MEVEHTFGRKFYDHDVPKLVEALLKVAVALEDVSRKLKPQNENAPQAAPQGAVEH